MAFIDQKPVLLTITQVNLTIVRVFARASPMASLTAFGEVHQIGKNKQFRQRNPHNPRMAYNREEQQKSFFTDFSSLLKF